MVLTSGTKQLAEYSYVVTPISSSVEKTILLLLVSGAGAFLNQVFMYSSLCVSVVPPRRIGGVWGNNHIYISSSRKLTREAQGGKAEEGIKTPMLLFTPVTNTLYCSALHHRKESRYKHRRSQPSPALQTFRKEISLQHKSQHLANCGATKIRGFEASHGQLKGVWKGIGVAIGKGDLLTPSVNFAIKEDLRAEM